MVSEHDTVAETVRVEGARILATLIRTVGDVQIAEDAVQEATLAALGAWPVTGVPPQPRAWLTVTARRKATTSSGASGPARARSGTAGHAPVDGRAAYDVDACAEAVRLADLLHDLLPDQPMPAAVLALCSSPRPAGRHGSTSMVTP